MRPDAFAFVMATGIVSIAAADHGIDWISASLAVVAAVGMPVLMYLTARRWHFDVRDYTVALPLFTYVAACSVLAARFAEHRVVVWIFAGMALQGWLSLAPLTVRSMWRHRRTRLRDDARGGWELAAVATSGLAIVFADLDIVFWAVVFWALGICVYVFMTLLIAGRIDLAQPDGWILMGGAAIATLAGDHLHHILPPGPFADAVRVVTLVTWVVATLWIPPLAYVALRRFAGIGWPTVFPLGMYASAAYAMSVETGWGWFVDVSMVFLWIALAAWLSVAVQSLQRFRRSRAADTPSDQAR
ncbi:tellurite resistance/C4-dicarboxylate transporter family protein [Mycobacterium sp. B14F4]|uniref:tellurite resistance/C4-dicarboxylate transporter family protein n=1 Tax=Mycobacterium sp. B14F4 TaxID=3153565 RepID=UPI00325D6117